MSFNLAFLFCVEDVYLDALLNIMVRSVMKPSFVLLSLWLATSNPLALAVWIMSANTDNALTISTSCSFALGNSTRRMPPWNCFVVMSNFCSQIFVFHIYLIIKSFVLSVYIIYIFHLMSILIIFCILVCSYFIFGN